LPALLPGDREGLTLQHSQPASTLLLDDLRGDVGMEWVPTQAWLTKLRVTSTAANLRYDLAVDTSGNQAPSRVAAGLEPVVEQPLPLDEAPYVAGIALVPAALLWLRRRSRP
jgi:hypothetical protein